MRMWNVPPKEMCQKHLCGEHVETHMAIGSMIKGISMQGYVDGGLLELHNLHSRHAALAEEMLRRGYKHLSPLPPCHTPIAGYVDIAANKKELSRIGAKCRDLQDAS